MAKKKAKPIILTESELAEAQEVLRRSPLNSCGFSEVSGVDEDTEVSALIGARVAALDVDGRGNALVIVTQDEESRGAGEKLKAAGFRKLGVINNSNTDNDLSLWVGESIDSEDLSEYQEDLIYKFQF